MAGDAAVDTRMIGYISREHEHSLESLWPFADLTVARSEDGYWIRGFKESILQDKEVQSAPMLRMYRFEEPFLYLGKNRVPERKLPHGLLWTPIQTAFRLKLPSHNENLFEVKGNLIVSLVSSKQERKVAASIVDLKALKRYVDTEPQFFFNHLNWCILNEKSALLLGAKVLPIPSQRYWSDQGLYLPSGFAFQHSYLATILSLEQQKATDYWFFREDGSHYKVDSNALVPLTRSSVKSTTASW